MKILIIPDIHCRKFWRKAIEKYLDSVDKVIFLGDYLDPYYPEFEENPENFEFKDFNDYEVNLKMLNDIVELKKNNPDKVILLCGNHTCSYIWSDFTAATRTDKLNWKFYNNFFKENLKYFNLVYVQDNVIFSHAGITNSWKGKFKILDVAEYLQKVSLEDVDYKLIQRLSMISHWRGGFDLSGSCEWASIEEHIESIDNSKIIPKGEDGIFQIFGHTQLKSQLITDKWACLDCRKAFLFDGNEITECKI